MKKLLKKIQYYIFVKESKWNLVAIAIAFVIFSTYKFYHHSFVKEGNYTIGKIYKIYWPVVSHKKLYYEYVFKDIKYDAMDIYNSGKKPEENKRYLIRVSLKDPKESDIFQDIPVPDSIKEAPSEGWKELPKWAEKNNR